MTTKQVARAMWSMIAAAVCFPAAMPAQAQNLPGWGYAQHFMGDITRQQRQEQLREQQAARRQYQEQQAADARARAPHEASAQYSGQLTPFSDLKRLIAGKTLYMERPIVAGNQIQNMRTNETYFSADGKSYSIAWSGRPWMTADNQVCLDSIQPQNCWRVFRDDARELYFVPATNLVMHISRIEQGDPANTRTQFAQRRRNEQLQGAALLGAAQLLFGGGGGGDSSGMSPAGRQMMIDNAEAGRYRLNPSQRP